MFGRLGPFELILILVIALVIFGPSKLPQIGNAMGQAIREFRKGTKEIQKDLDNIGSEESSNETKTAETKKAEN